MMKQQKNRRQQFQVQLHPYPYQIMNNNLVDLISQSKHYEAHRKKIAEIMSSTTGRAKVGTFDNKRIQVMNTYYENRDRATRFSLKSKQEAVQKQNDLILKKIIEANSRRSGSLINRYQSITHNSLANLKRHQQSINQQNQKIAQKLVTTNSDLRQEKLVESFKKHLECKQRIKKYEFDEQVGMTIPKKIKSMQKLKNIQGIRNTNRGVPGNQEQNKDQDNQ